MRPPIGVSLRSGLAGAVILRICPIFVAFESRSPFAVWNFHLAPVMFHVFVAFEALGSLARHRDWTSLQMCYLGTRRLQKDPEHDYIHSVLPRSGLTFFCLPSYHFFGSNQAQLCTRFAFAHSLVVVHSERQPVARSRTFLLHCCISRRTRRQVSWLVHHFRDPRFDLAIFGGQIPLFRLQVKRSQQSSLSSWPTSKGSRPQSEQVKLSNRCQVFSLGNCRTDSWSLPHQHHRHVEANPDPFQQVHFGHVGVQGDVGSSKNFFHFRQYFGLLEYWVCNYHWPCQPLQYSDWAPCRLIFSVAMYPSNLETWVSGDGPSPMSWDPFWDQKKT